jgi:hypothetical protein
MAERPVHQVQNHTCWVTPLQPARLAGVLGQHSSLRHHWYEPEERAVLFLPETDYAIYL